MSLQSNLYEPSCTGVPFLRNGKMIKNANTLLIFIGMVVFGTACATAGPGTFSATGFLHTDYGYTVRPKSGGNATILPREWILDNYYGENNEPKTGVDYQVKYYVDVNRDGESELVGKLFKYDLLFTHRHHGGIIWLSTEPLDLDMKEKDLAVLLDSDLSELAGIHYGSIELQGTRFRTSSEKEFATKVLEMTPGTVAGMEAIAATVDIVNINQFRFDPNTPRDRMRLVFVRTSFQCKTRKRDTTLPVLMIAGYANRDCDFDKGISDFNDFISRIAVGGKSGTEFQPAQKSGVVATPIASPKTEDSSPSTPTATPENATPTEGNAQDAGSSQDETGL